ncbi:MAG: hypothetical protein JWQ02_3888 [Capsulimonas sp.]|nr:hypothetical protein [Capsulimonas sp.]
MKYKQGQEDGSKDAEIFIVSLLSAFRILAAPGFGGNSFFTQAYQRISVGGV